MVGVGEVPEDCVGIARVNAAGVAKGDVAVDLAVNQEDGNVGGRDRIF